MGIREHLSKEVDKKEMKLSELSVTEYEQKNDDLVDESDYDYLIEHCDTEDELEKLRNISYLRILFPERVSELELDIDVEMLSKLERTLSRYTRELSMSYSWCNDAKLALPDLSIKDFKASIMKAYDFDKVANTMLRYLNPEVTNMFQKHRFDFNVVLFVKLFLRDEDRIADILDEDYFEKHKKQMDIDRAKGELWKFLKAAVSLKLLFSERFDESNITDQDIDKLIAYFKSRKNKEIDENRDRSRDERYSYVYAVMIRLLQAEKIEFDDYGMKVIMPKRENFKEKKSSRPKRKTF